MTRWIWAVVAIIVPACLFVACRPDGPQVDSRREVVFWHFWGGEDRATVESIVERYNASQVTYRVRAVAMPGNNLDLKLFLAVAGGRPPDVVNQDDPIIADWASRGALTPLDALTDEEELSRLTAWQFPAAKKLTDYEGRAYGLCNGLDIRALYFDRTLLEQHGETPPATVADLDRLSQTLQERNADGRVERFGYLPDPRRLWAWGVVFGGRFYDPLARRVTCDEPPVVAALEWMEGYRRREGAATLAAFRQGDQSLPGAAFPLLPVGDALHGRYGLILDGQWRVRDIAAFQEARKRRGVPAAEYGVCPLPPPPNGRRNAGWVNGNFFVVPRGARCPDGAWDFMKFWSGFDGNEDAAAESCAAGGWIPASQAVVERPAFQAFLQQRPLFAEFVKLAGSDAQIPIPAIAGAPRYNRELRRIGETVLYRDDSPPPAALLRQTAVETQRRLEQSRLQGRRQD